MPTSTDPQGTCECCLTPADRCRRTTGVSACCGPCAATKGATHLPG
jgi:hypothetical protein